jgi:hypothetical protein
LVVETENLGGTLDYHTHLVMVLTAGQARTMRGRPDFDQQNRLLRQWWDVEHMSVSPASFTGCRSNPATGAEGGAGKDQSPSSMAWGEW